MADETMDKVGERLGGFQILDKIAEGGMGTVYKARQVSLDRIVAIKVLPKHLAENTSYVRQFQQESRVAARLKHPHLIEVYDAGHDEGKHYFVMEHVEGETVGDKLRRDGPFPEMFAVQICLHVAQALQYAWEKAQLIHGDIKPENLILERDTKRVRIADLGLGKSLLIRSDDAHEETTYAMGTPAYVCPERARGEKKLDFRADMYALGATFYHMLTGHVPFDGLTPAEVMAQHMSGQLPDPRNARPGISEATVIVLERMMAKKPEERYPSWAALAHDLAQVEHGRSPSVPPLAPARSTIAREAPSRQALPKIKKRASVLRIVIELAIILIGLGIVYWYIHTRPHQPEGALPSLPVPRETTPPQPEPAELPLSPTEDSNRLTPSIADMERERREKEEVAKKLAEEEEEERRKLAEEHAREAQRKAEAEEKYENWRRSFEATLASGDFAKAKESAAAALAEPDLAAVKDKVERDLRIAEMTLGLKETARANLVGQTYYVGTTPGTVSKVENDKFWVKLAAGEVALNFDSVDPAKLPSLALSKNREDPQINLAAGLYCWYRGERDIAKTYFAVAMKSGSDVSRYLPTELSSPPSSADKPIETAPPLPERSAILDTRLNLLANPGFERWSGATLLDWTTANSQVRPFLDTENIVGGMRSVRFECGGNTQSINIEQPFQVVAGKTYRLQFYFRTRGFDGKLWVETGPPGDPTPNVKHQLEGSPDWQLATLEFSCATAGTMVVRVRSSNASGTVWLDNFDLRLTGR